MPGPRPGPGVLPRRRGTPQRTGWGGLGDPGTHSRTARAPTLRAAAARALIGCRAGKGRVLPGHAPIRGGVWEDTPLVGVVREDPPRAGTPAAEPEDPPISAPTAKAMLGVPLPPGPPGRMPRCQHGQVRKSGHSSAKAFVFVSVAVTGL